MRYDITNIAVEDYLTDLILPRSPALQELEQRAREHGLSLVGPVQGQLLYLLTRSLRARDALEVGTTTGYAAIWILQALRAEGGHLTAIESDSERYNLANEFLQKAGFIDSVTVHQGNWADILPRMNMAAYDLIFLDVLRSLTSADQAVRTLDMCVPLLRPGGLLITDNVLCSAEVIEEDVSPTVRGIQQFNRAVMNHSELDSVVLPIRDGIAISRKRTE